MSPTTAVQPKATEPPRVRQSSAVVVCSAFPTLPPRWWEGLSRPQIAHVIRVESIPPERLIEELGNPSTHAKGYVRLQLGRAHPYASTSGQQYLHRYLKMRQKRRVLLECEHVHHKEIEPGRFAALDSHDVEDFETMLDTEHGHYHWHWHHECRCQQQNTNLADLEAQAQEYADRFDPGAQAGASF
jgi:hypothetical protein